MSDVVTISPTTQSFERRAARLVQDAGSAIIALASAVRARSVTMQQGFGAEIRDQAAGMADIVARLDYRNNGDEVLSAVCALSEAVEWLGKLHSATPVSLRHHLASLEEELDHLQKLVASVRGEGKDRAIV